jgi:hypothetical protein
MDHGPILGIFSLKKIGDFDPDLRFLGKKAIMTLVLKIFSIFAENWSKSPKSDLNTIYVPT